jgi:hypothetical protein
MRRKFLFITIAVAAMATSVDARKKGDSKVVKQLKADITYLASDELEGRRTGTEGERKAAEYIEKRYNQLHIQPYKGNYKHTFTFTYGKEVTQSSTIKLYNKILKLDEEAFPLPFSANRKVTSDVLPEVTEQGNIWLQQLYTDQAQADDPHFDVDKSMYDASVAAKNGGATGIVFYNNFNSKYEPVFNKHSEYEPVTIPVAFINNKAWDKYVHQTDLINMKSGVPVTLDITVRKTERKGTNIAAYIDNKAPYTVILGAHFDHLGYGEDGNSLHANAKSEHQVHHGADDNASGTAALLELAKWVKHKKLKHYNYLFLHFSGEELGLYGSKAFVKDEGIDSAHTAYMINMDMVGRLNDSTHSLSVGGVGTSPLWKEAVDLAGPDFKLVLDSSGIGPSDHTTFYYAGIPVLFFFTGTHKDYHKPSDKPELVNYSGEEKVLEYAQRVIAKLDKENSKPAFTPTKQNVVSGKTRFKVTLGIMPDYTFQEGGVRVDGVSDGRPAANAGLKAGDIIVRLGNIVINGMQTYMEALSKFSPGDKTTIRFLRNGKEIALPIELSKK